jgi:transposase
MVQAAGFDTSKRELAAFFEGSFEVIGNDRKSIKRYLKRLPEGTLLGIESTGRLHLKLVEQALELGFTVYVVSTKEFFLYRKSLSFRVKSDPQDSELLARFVANEHDRLRPYVRPSHRCRLATELIRQRDLLVRTLVALRTSLGQVPSEALPLMQPSLLAIQKLEEAVLDLEEKLLLLMRDSEAYRRLLKVPGIGKITAAALVLAYERGSFARADSFVAYAGLDLEVADSGTKRGRRRLTKRGDRLLRCLLYTAASAGSKCECWKTCYQNAKARGWKSTQAILILARKMLRTAWALLHYGREFVANYA